VRRSVPTIRNRKVTLEMLDVGRQVRSAGSQAHVPTRQPQLCLNNYTHNIRNTYHSKPISISQMSPVSRLARLLLILHAAVNFLLGIYSFINPSKVLAITGVEASDQVLQSIGTVFLSHPIYLSLSEKRRHPHDFPRPCVRRANACML
jgi:hypothetical protein